ncbi:hypothetical protein D3C86_1913340 [compost metagenome]
MQAEVQLGLGAVVSRARHFMFQPCPAVLARALERLHPGLAFLAQPQRHMGRGQAPVGRIEVLRLQPHDLGLGRRQRAPHGLVLRRRHLKFQFDFVHKLLPMLRACE